MIWDTVPKKICNGPIRIGTIFAIRGNFCFYDVVNTFQHLYWILGLFSIKNKKLKAVCNGPIKICIIFPTMKSHGNFCFFRPYENFPTSSMLILPIFKRKQIARNNLQLIKYAKYLQSWHILIKMLESVPEVVETKISMHCEYFANFHGSIAIFLWHRV